MTLRNKLILALIFSILGGGAVVPRSFAQDAGAPQAQAPRIIEITVEGGYHPDRPVVHEGERVQLRFLRKEYSGCTLEVVFPTLGLRQTLPPNQPVVIDLGTPAAGEIPFHCGMNMIHGTIVIQSGDGA